MPIAHDFSLDAKYRQEDGTILLSGIQALVRSATRPAPRRSAARPQHGHADLRLPRLAARGVRSHARAQPQAAAVTHNVVFISGVNEDLGATAVYGSQLANLLPAGQVRRRARRLVRQGPRRRPHRRHLQARQLRRHRQARRRAGAGRRRSALEVLDAARRTPRWRFYDAQFPVLFPGNVQEILDLGRLGFELSRYSRAMGRLQDRDQCRRRDRHRPGRPRPRGDRRPRLPVRGQAVAATPRTRCCCRPYGLDIEREIHYGRLEAAQGRLPPPTGSTGSRSTRRDAWLGIAAAGKAYYDLREALRELGLDDGRAAAPRRPAPQGRHAVPDGARHRAAVRAGPRGDPRRRGEARRSSSCSCATSLYNRRRAPARDRQA